MSQKQMESCMSLSTVNKPKDSGLWLVTWTPLKCHTIWFSSLTILSAVPLFKVLPLCNCDPSWHIELGSLVHWGDCGFSNYHTILIAECSVPNLLENVYDKIMYLKVLTVPKSNQFTISRVEKFINHHWLLWKFWVFKSNFEVEILTHATV